MNFTNNFCIKILIILLVGATAYGSKWEPGSGLEQVNIWPAQPPEGGEKSIEDENMEVGTKKIGGKFITGVYNVTQPTMTVYSPKVNNGTAVIVFPGGGHLGLAIDVEGTEVCEWLNQANITCVLLKYRVPHSGCYYDKKTHKNITPAVPMALQDAQRTISTIRYHAKKYKINPDKIGVMGFSAGGNVAVLTSTALDNRSYKSTDEIDKVSCSPNFAIPVFAGHMTMAHKNVEGFKEKMKLNTDIKISKDVPPTFLVHAKDDPVNPVYYSELYEKELKKAGVNVRFNKYKTGGHAFGVRKQGKDTDRWPQEALLWLNEIKML